MSKDITQFNLETLPLGFCPKCIDHMRSGRLFKAHRVAEGEHLLDAYCLERQVGATLALSAGRPQQWRMVAPVDAVDWEESVRLRTQTYCGVREMARRLRGPDIVPDPGKLN